MNIIDARYCARKTSDDAVPFGTLAKRLIVNLINAADDPMEREERIQIAVEEGLLSYAESYRLRTDGEL